MKNIKLVTRIAVILTVFMLSSKAEAKWWIFGQSNEEITINYMFLNTISYDESGPAVTLYKMTLPDGMIVINGKASARSGKIGRVRVTTDNKETWEKAKTSDNGAFEYSFKPEENKTYTVFVEVADTAGKTNTVEETRKEISISDQNLMTSMGEVLDKMIESYRNKDATGFMSQVSEDFAGDTSSLDHAIRKDFSNFENLDVRYTINNVATGKDGLYVSITYTLLLTPSRNTNTSLLSENGITEFVFKFGERGPMVYSMKHPIIFGRSSAAEIATGIVNNISNNQVIIVAPTGEVSTVSFQDAQQGEWGAESGLAETAVINTNPPNNFDSFGFAFGDVTNENWVDKCAGSISGDFGAYGVNHHVSVKTGVTVADQGVMSLGSLTTAPGGGYVDPNALCAPNSTFLLQQGHVYVFKLPGNAYGAIEVTGFSGNLTTFKYVYSPSGPNF